MTETIADVCLLLEGTYPFVQGGVSSWVHNVIRGLPDISFSLLHLGASPHDRYERKYDLPPNVREIQQVFLHAGTHLDAPPRRRSGQARAHGEVWQALHDFHDRSKRSGAVSSFASLVPALCADGRTDLSLPELLTSRDAWDLLTWLYSELAPDLSFVDFYWTWRYTHVPLMALMHSSIPRARVYHTLSTGYAGWLGACTALRYDMPLVLTEHGIYTRERAIEIAQSQWIYEPRAKHPFVIQREHSFFKQWWIDLFRYMSQVTYARAERILTITSINQKAQLRDGADPDKMEVIPNAINPDVFAALRRERPADAEVFTVGFVGRVVRIKDVKTFIRAMKIVASTVPNLRVLVVGPTDEEQDYFADCKRLVDTLGLSQQLTFVGQARVTEIYPLLDVLVLTSLSEAQPLVVLEANCAGVPAVASNVGACDELLLGRTAEDRALGPSGILTAVASPNETAQAVIRLWREPDLRWQLQKAGMQRVERFYREEDLLARYRSIYTELAGRG